MLSQSIKIILFVLIGALTAASCSFVDRYREVGDQILLNSEFSEGLRFWQVQKTPRAEVAVLGNVLQITSGTVEENVQIWQDVPAELNGAKVRLQATMKTEGVVGKGKSWNRARLLLLQPHQWQGKYFAFRIVASLSGTHDWKTYGRVVPTVRSLGSQVRIQLPDSRGTFWVKEVHMYRVEERAVYRLIKWVFIALWASFIVALFVPVLKVNNRILPFITVPTLLLIVAGTAMSGSVKNHLKYLVLSRLDRYVFPIQKVIWMISYRFNLEPAVFDLTKVAHFLLFGAFTFMFLLGNPGRSKALQLGDVFMLACATECIQFFVDGRSPLFTDVLIDMAGGLAALSLYALLVRVGVFKRQNA